MELTGSVLTALFVGLVWALIRVVEFFVSKYKTTKETGHEIVLKKLQDDLQRTNKEQCNMLGKILQHCENLDNMHSVYNENHVPAWYIPPDMIKLIRENNDLSKLLNRELEEHMDEFKDNQDVVVLKMTELIASQKIMTERLGDLISALTKISR